MKSTEEILALNGFEFNLFEELQVKLAMREFGLEVLNELKFKILDPYDTEEFSVYHRQMKTVFKEIETELMKKVSVSYMK